MTKQSLPAVSTLETAESLEEFKTADKLVLVGYFDADDKVASEVYTEFANERRDDYLFGATSDDALAKAEGVTKPAIVLYKDFDEGKNVFSEKFEKEAIATFAKTAGTPLVGEVGPETYQGYMQVSHLRPRRRVIYKLIEPCRLVSLSPTSSPRPLRSARNSLMPSAPSLRSTRA